MRSIGPMSALAAVLALAALPARADVRIADEPDPLFDKLDIPADAATKGMWSSKADWPLIGLHLSLLPSGDVMSYGTPRGKPVQNVRSFDVWDPKVGFGKDAHYTFPNVQWISSFCSAATYLPSGQMLISGGNTPNASTLINRRANKAALVESQLAEPRWYGTMISLSDGRQLMVGGGNPYISEAYLDVRGSYRRGDIALTPEVYASGEGWSKLTGARSRAAFGTETNQWWYPRAWAVRDGKVFGLSAEQMWTLDPNAEGSIRIHGAFKPKPGDASRPNIGATSTAVMYAPGRILQVGGNGVSNNQYNPSSAGATVFDVRKSEPVVRDVAPMSAPRQWANSTLLPDGRVVVTGGSGLGDTAEENAVYKSELWDPQTENWTDGASAAVYRGYHSATVLLPNGTVLSTGGGVPGPFDNFNAEVFYPPYLFKKQARASVLAARPRLAAVNAIKFAHGAKLRLTLAEATSISKVAVIGLSSTTHSFNTHQRPLAVSFVQAGKMISVKLPSKPDLAPPGYYMAFVLDGEGTPSRGVIFALGAATVSPLR